MRRGALLATALLAACGQNDPEPAADPVGDPRQAVEAGDPTTLVRTVEGELEELER